MFDINHQQTQEVRPDWNIENDNANYTFLITWSFTNGSGAIFENIRSSAKDLDCELFYSELKRHNVSHYIYYLIDNIPVRKR